MRQGGLTNQAHFLTALAMSRTTIAQVERGSDGTWGDLNKMLAGAEFRQNALQGWVAIHQALYTPGVAAKTAENALQGCRQGVAMQTISKIAGWRQARRSSLPILPVG